MLTRLLISVAICSVSLTAPAATLRWQFDIDEQQVRNSGFGDGSTDSPGTGTGIVTYDTNTNLLSYSISWANLAGELTKLHIHGPATADASNPQHVVEIFGPPDIPASVDLQNDTWTDTVELTTLVQPNFPPLSPAEIIDIMSQGLAYVNVHTSLIGSGEIRGNMGLPTVVPEPTSLAVLAIGAIGAACRLRRRRS